MHPHARARSPADLIVVPFYGHANDPTTTLFLLLIEGPPPLESDPKETTFGLTSTTSNVHTYVHTYITFFKHVTLHALSPYVQTLRLGNLIGSLDMQHPAYNVHDLRSDTVCVAHHRSLASQSANRHSRIGWSL